jgi:hypothetical protein
MPKHAYALSPGTYAAVALLTLVCTSGCNHSHQSTQAGGSPLAPSTPPPSPSSPAPSPSAIPVNETHHGTLREGLLQCTFETVIGGWGGLCQTFDITAPSSGLLTATLRWSADAPLNLFFKRGDGTQIDMVCCDRPSISLTMPIEMGATYRLEVAYCGRPPVYPHIAPVDYTLDTTLVVGNAGPVGSVKAMIFADEQGSQHIANAKLEVRDGLRAGTVAALDP